MNKDNLVQYKKSLNKFLSEQESHYGGNIVVIIDRDSAVQVFHVEQSKVLRIFKTFSLFSNFLNKYYL